MHIYIIMKLHLNTLIGKINTLISNNSIKIKHGKTFTLIVLLSTITFLKALE